MSENLSSSLRSHHEIATEFIYVYTVQDCLMCIADCYFCASRLTFSSLLLARCFLTLRLWIWRTAFLWCCWLNKLNKFINSWWSRMSGNSIYSCLIYGCLIYFVYMYVLWKWDSKMCILTTLIGLSSLIFLFLFFFDGELLGGGGWLYRPSPPPTWKIGGIYPPPIPPGIDTHGEDLLHNSDITDKNVWKGGGSEEKSASPALLYVTCRPRWTFFKVDY